MKNLLQTIQQFFSVESGFSILPSNI